MRTVYIDADGCPVVSLCVDVCKEKGAECVIVCDDAHHIFRDGAKTVTVSRGADSADFKIVNMVKGENAIVVTGDYGLAAMALAKSATVINPDGLLYTKDNIDGLLFYRHEAKKARRAGKRAAPIPKRTAFQNESFKKALADLLEK